MSKLLRYLLVVPLLTTAASATAAVTAIGNQVNGLAAYSQTSSTGASLSHDAIAPIPYTNRAYSQASLGSLGAYGIALGAGPAFFEMHAYANALWQDSFTIAAPGSTQLARFSFALNATGLMTTWWTSEIPFSQSRSVYTFRWQIDASPPQGVTGPLLTSQGGRSYTVFGTPGSPHLAEDLSETTSNFADFYVGGKMTVTMRLDIEAHASDSGNRHTFFVGAASDFEHTINWGGITSITDANGVPLTGVSIAAASGVDYSRPIPEPQAALLLAATISMNLAARRNRRNNVA